MDGDFIKARLNLIQRYSLKKSVNLLNYENFINKTKIHLSPSLEVDMPLNLIVNE